MDGTTNIVELKGIGEKSATAFGRLGIRDVDSLITIWFVLHIRKMSHHPIHKNYGYYLLDR